MGMHVVYADVAGDSRLCEVAIAGQGPSLDALLPCRGWRPFQCAPGGHQDFHCTPVAGMTLMLGGCMRVTVSAGAQRAVDLRPGDLLLVLDSQGKGHATDILGPDWLRVAGVAFHREDWPQIQSAFAGWPVDLQAP